MKQQNKSKQYDLEKRGKESMRKKIRELKENNKWTRKMVNCHCNGVCNFSCIKQ